MVDAFVRSGCMDQVPPLPDETKTDAGEPHIITYSVLVKDIAAWAASTGRSRFLADTESDGIFAPDEILYNPLLDGCARQDRVGEARWLMGDMRTSGVAPSYFARASW